MPLNSQFGFIFTKANTTSAQLNRTIAHVPMAIGIAHGAFHLWHTFSSSNTYTAPQGTTNNLMDYNGTNSELYKYQWDYIHNPQQGIVRWMVEEEEGEMTTKNAIVAEILKTIHDANTAQKDTCNVNKYGTENVFMATDYQLNDNVVNILITKRNTNKLPIYCSRTNCDIKKSARTTAFGKNGNYTTFTFYNDEYDNALEILIADDYADELAEWLFGKDPIAKALSVIETYIGKPYYNDVGQLRTDTNDAALAQMDCSELVCRFLQIACGLDEVPLMTTADFKTLVDVGNDYIQYIPNSRFESYSDIRPGDIFLWRRKDEGHVGVVKEYDNDIVTIIEAIASGGSREERLYNSSTCKGCVRESKYTRTGNALMQHDGWQGYFRPIVKF